MKTGNNLHISMDFQRKKPSFLKQFARNFVLRSDMFAAQPTLRYAGQSSYETLFGGFLSIILVVAFMVIFSTTFYDVLTKVFQLINLERKLAKKPSAF